MLSLKKLFFQNINKNLAIFIASNKLVSTSASRLNDKKKADYVKENDFSKEKSKVKLYPGFQDSIEEIRYGKPKEVNETNAKKVIEDFYGLNELEYEKEEQNKEEFEDEEQSFDLDFVVKTLRNERIQDICCINLPKDVNYADYLITATCMSEKHMNSSFLTINRKYKRCKNTNGNFLKKSLGKENKWCAIDTGKIVIHLFLPEYRDYYNLESLWSCGVENDEKCIQFKEEKLEVEKRINLIEVKE